MGITSPRFCIYHAHEANHLGKHTSKDFDTPKTSEGLLHVGRSFDQDNW
jgi:hypothetical protein